MAPQELTPKQQWSEYIKTAKSILILTHQDPDGDALGSAIALKIGLEKLGKEVTVASSGNVNQIYKFLPQIENLQPELKIRKDLHLILDETNAKVGNVSLKRLSETKLSVVITPKEGFLTSKDVRIEEGGYNTDLVIVLDCTNLERLGQIYENNADLFYEVPVINIDHHPGNPNFGKINLIDITASSTAEILVSLMEVLTKDGPSIFDEEISTCLLTGLTFDTGSFQNSNTTPKSLTIAAQLVAAGARQQDIIKNLFKTKPLSTLRLWGRALSYIKEDQPLRFAWSVLTKADFVAAQAGPEESSGVIDELLKTATQMDFVLLLTEKDGQINGSLRACNPTVDVLKLANLFGGGGHNQAAGFTGIEGKLAQKEMEIVGKIKNFLSKGSKPQSVNTEETPKEEVAA